ncbi:hypothetical protein B0H11DRAFT_2434149 [Mycena galericulata]|nr:hypothetical protein B0H11DRAFT_2434149 [Mycena galericulata]
MTTAYQTTRKTSSSSSASMVVFAIIIRIWNTMSKALSTSAATMTSKTHTKITKKFGIMGRVTKVAHISAILQFASAAPGHPDLGSLTADSDEQYAAMDATRTPDYPDKCLNKNTKFRHCAAQALFLQHAVDLAHHSLQPRAHMHDTAKWRMHIPMHGEETLGPAARRAQQLSDESAVRPAHAYRQRTAATRAHPMQSARMRAVYSIRTKNSADEAPVARSGVPAC